jgi:hypothetical protein
MSSLGAFGSLGFESVVVTIYGRDDTAAIQGREHPALLNVPTSSRGGAASHVD